MKLSAKDIERGLAGTKGWAFKKKALSRRFTFKSFPDAIGFVTRLAFAAEAADHHPDLLVSYKDVTVTWSTHSEGGVTEKDVAGAKQSGTIAKKFGIGA